ncbi:MAG TPA: cytochrome c oxidase accessory protein CcoG [Caulobacteraceae bacterium]|nr:cytochrome c oxidase accessory protein CcoG [Caulobacteraceae bacterium]
MTVVIDRTSEHPVAAKAGPVSAAAAAREKAKRGVGLYKPRTPIYPKLAHGRWRTIKWIVLVATLSVYYLIPWVRWPRPAGAPQQAVLVDFAGRHFYFFFIQLWPQEVYFITGLLVMAALTLFLVTALFGRLWCGYTCPQTVWTDLYIAVERLFEGDRNARMRLDAAPWSLDKVWRKGGKHLTWLAIAVATGGAWIFYFEDAPTLWGQVWSGTAPVTAYFSVALFTFTTYVLAGTMREQVCTYLCPWPRIQGAMLDEHSLQVTYRRDRGEPRGPHKKGESWDTRGDCVDCNACVVVCPTGIDIRKGSQLECINCGLCVDACDEIMERVGRPRDLIAYDTDSAIADHLAGRKPVYKFVRARTVYYGTALVVVSCLMLWGLATRSPVIFEALRDRNPTFVRLHDGAIRNGFTLKIDNRSFEPRAFTVAVSGVPDAIMKTPGAAPTTGTIAINVAPNQVLAVRLFVTEPAQDVSGDTAINFKLSQGPRSWTVASRFLTADQVVQ